MSPGPPLAANAPLPPWSQHPTLNSLQPSLQITADCWALLAAPDGSSRKDHYLPKGDREPEAAYRKRLDAARPSGFFRDALRTYAGMLSRGSWISLPTSLSSVLTDVDGRGTDLGVFLAAADLLVATDGYSALTIHMTKLDRHGLQLQHAQHALAAAHDIRNRMTALASFCTELGLAPIDVGIGIESGPALVGNFGSLHRRTFTALGEPVVLASRLEGLTSQYQQQILIGQGCASLLGADAVRTLGQVAIRGRLQPLTMYVPA